MKKNLFLVLGFVTSINFMQIHASEEGGTFHKFVGSLRSRISSSRPPSRNEDLELQDIHSVAKDFILPVVDEATSRVIESRNSQVESRNSSRASFKGYSTDEEYRSSPQVKAAFFGIRISNSSADIAGKVIASSPSPVTAEWAASEMISTAKRNSPFIQECKDVLRKRIGDNNMKMLYQDGFDAVQALPSPESNCYIDNLIADIAGLEQCNDYYKKAGFLPQKQKQLAALKELKQLVDTCNEAKELNIK